MDIAQRKAETKFLVNNKGKHEFMYIYQLKKTVTGVNFTNNSLQLLSPLGGYNYNRFLNIHSMPSFFEARNGGTDPELTTLSIAKNILSFYSQRKQDQSFTDNKIKIQNKRVEQPLITYKILFSKAGKSFKDTKSYKDFISQSKGSYPFDYKILLIHHIRPHPEIKQDYSTTYPSIEMRRIVIIKHFDITKKKEYEGTVFAIPSFLVPSFKNVFPSETGFNISNDPTVYKNFKTAVNLKKTYTLDQNKPNKGD